MVNKDNKPHGRAFNKKLTASIEIDKIYEGL